jgi:transcription antitermination protein NusB
LKSPRRKARELALQSLYHWLLNPDDLGVIQVDVIARDGAKRYDKVFYNALFEGVIGDMPRLRDALQPHLDRPQVEVSPIEHAILLAGAFELMHHLETPYRVIINESIELAKSFGGTDGHKYVNGVLDKLASQVRPHG